MNSVLDFIRWTTKTELEGMPRGIRTTEYIMHGIRIAFGVSIFLFCLYVGWKESDWVMAMLGLWGGPFIITILGDFDVVDRDKRK